MEKRTKAPSKSLRSGLGGLLLAALATASIVGASPLANVGKLLFFDVALSADGKVACATCHQPGRAFADGRPVSSGAFGLQGTRNAPSLLDVAQRPALAWDGRTGTLSDQVALALSHPREHALAGPRIVVELVLRNEGYRKAFSDAGLDDPLTSSAIGSALVAYIESLRTEASPFDRWRAGDSAAISGSARRGFEVFRGVAGCARCHRIDGERPTFTDNEFHAVGVGSERIASRLAALVTGVRAATHEQLELLIATDPEIAALGRFLVTRDPADIGKYRTPGLRNVAVTAPYFHDGSARTLADALAQELYYRGRERGQPMAITTAEQADLVAFLESLTDDRYSPPTAANVPALRLQVGLSERRTFARPEVGKGR